MRRASCLRSAGVHSSDFSCTARAPAPVHLAGTNERLLGRVESTGADRDRSDRELDQLITSP